MSADAPRLDRITIIDQLTTIQSPVHELIRECLASNRRFGDRCRVLTSAGVTAADDLIHVLRDWAADPGADGVRELLTTVRPGLGLTGAGGRYAVGLLRAALGGDESSLREEVQRVWRHESERVATLQALRGVGLVDQLVGQWNRTTLPPAAGRLRALIDGAGLTLADVAAVARGGDAVAKFVLGDAEADGAERELADCLLRMACDSAVVRDEADGRPAPAAESSAAPSTSEDTTYVSSVRTAAGSEATTEVRPGPPAGVTLPVPAVGSIPRLTVDLETQTLTLNGNNYDVRSEPALRWVRVLAAFPGQWFVARELVRHDTELDGVRTDRLKPRLPEGVQKLIDSEAGRGSRIRL